MGTISYRGRVVNNAGQTKLTLSKKDTYVLDILLAEQHRGKNGRVAKQYQKPELSADDYVNTTTSWHRLTVFGDEAARLATDPNVNNGSTLVVTNASYTEEDAWTTKDGVERAGRPETANDDTSISVFVSQNGNVFGPYDDFQFPLWDGVSPLPRKSGSGGGVPRVDPYAGQDVGF